MKSANALFVASALLVAISLTGPQAAARRSKSGPQTAETSQSSLEQQIIAQERAGLDALKAGDLAAFASLTGNGAVFVDDHGPATKAQVMKNVAGFKLTEYGIDDVRFVSLSPKSGLISYTITEKGNSHGKDFTAQAYVSSIWAKHGKRWACLFSQETAAKQSTAPATDKN